MTSNNNNQNQNNQNNNINSPSQPQGSFIAQNNLQDEIWRPRPSDSRGHGVNITVRVPPQTSRLISEFTQDPRFPYTDRTDFVRHAIIRHLQWVASLPDGPRSVIGQIMAAETVCEVEEAHQRFDIVLNRLNTIVMGLLNKNTQEARTKAISIIRKELRFMQDTGDPYYQQDFTSRIRSQYGDLINEIPMADFNDMEDGPVDIDEISQLITENEAEMIDNGEVE